MPTSDTTTKWRMLAQKRRVDRVSQTSGKVLIDAIACSSGVPFLVEVRPVGQDQTCCDPLARTKTARLQRASVCT